MARVALHRDAHVLQRRFQLGDRQAAIGVGVGVRLGIGLVFAEIDADIGELDRQARIRTGEQPVDDEAAIILRGVKLAQAGHLLAVRRAVVARHQLQVLDRVLAVDGAEQQNLRGGDRRLGDHRAGVAAQPDHTTCELHCILLGRAEPDRNRAPLLVRS